MRRPSETSKASAPPSHGKFMNLCAAQPTRLTPERWLAPKRTAQQAVLCRDDDEYPMLLRSIPDPPCGPLRTGHAGAARSERGSRSSAAASAAFTVASRPSDSRAARRRGIDRLQRRCAGIDSAAHRGAMAHPQGGRSRCSAAASTSPIRRRTKRCSSRSPSAAPSSASIRSARRPCAENFPRRNRIVSGMSRGVLVVEADENSGALITARRRSTTTAVRFSRFPARRQRHALAGPHKLIRDGATLVTKLEDILEGLDPLPHDAMEPIQNDMAVAPVSTESNNAPDPQVNRIVLSDSQQHILRHNSTAII